MVRNKPATAATDGAFCTTTADRFAASHGTISARTPTSAAAAPYHPASNAATDVEYRLRGVALCVV